MSKGSATTARLLVAVLLTLGLTLTVQVVPARRQRAPMSWLPEAH
jgi:hypothetical protein